MYLGIGIDLGIKTTHEVVVLEPGSQQPKAVFRCGHSRQELEEMLDRVQAGLPEGTELRFVMEPTDTAWVPVACFLLDKGHTVYLVKSEMVKDQRKVLKKYAKTDELDGTTLAKLPWIVPEALNKLLPREPRLETLRRRVKQAHKLSRDITRRQLRIQALVRLALPVGLGKLDLFSKAGQALCTGCLDPQGVLRMGVNRLTESLLHVAGHKAGTDAASVWFLACSEAVKLYGTNAPVDYEDLQDECDMEFQALGLEQEQLSKVHERIHALYLELHPSRNLETLYGVGPFVAAASVAAIGNPQRFANSRKFRAFTGMIPKVSSSGQTDSKSTQLSKAGPNWLKRALYIAAEIGRQYDPQLAKIYYDQVVKYGHHHRHAICAVASHLADRIFVVYRIDKPYELRDLEGKPISPRDARAYIQAHLTVPEGVRKRLRHQNKGKHRPRGIRAS